MNNVTYRAYQEADAARVKELVDEVFHVHHFTKGEGSLLDTSAKSA